MQRERVGVLVGIFVGVIINILRFLVLIGVGFIIIRVIFRIRLRRIGVITLGIITFTGKNVWGRIRGECVL